jgi:peptidyl-prolyl cis-trans isomerase B (cyclophilin B)
VLLCLALPLAACGSSEKKSSNGGSSSASSASQSSSQSNGQGSSRSSTSQGCTKVGTPPKQDAGKQKQPTRKLDTSKTWSLAVATNCGSFTIELDPEAAPNTSASLVALAKSGFFDGLGFHRIVPGFVIQGGDPTQSGSGGAGYTTVDVPPSDVAYTKGVVAMAKSPAEPPGTAGSQFFVVTGDDAGLPLEYAIVGKVTDGMDTVQRINALGVADGPPSKPVVVTSVTVRES